MRYKKIYTAGQITAVITDQIDVSDLSRVAKSIMANSSLIEQVGYLQGNNFQMMGGELSINGLIAGAYILGKSGRINGLDFLLTNNTITLSLPYFIVVGTDKQAKIVTLQGIKYQIIAGLQTSQNISTQNRQLLQTLTTNFPASGLIFYEKNQIQPLIYVPATNSYVWENACGSGSLAYSLITGNNQVIQPSGEMISFQFTNKNIVVTTAAKEV